MSDQLLAIARIPLARAPLRLIVAPLAATVAGVMAIVAAILIRGGPAGVALGLLGGLAAILALRVVTILLTVRLDVEVAAVHVRWAGGERRYPLARGAVTRVVVRGEGASSLRPRFGGFGWAVGPALLRGEERIEVVRLAPTATVILVPTQRGRLAVAPASEGDLLSALAAAARLQQRMEQAARATSASPRPAVSQGGGSALPAPALRGSVSASTASGIPATAQPRILTGIERARLEEEAAARRAAAEAAAEEERAARLRQPMAEPAAAVAAPASPVRARRLPRPRLARPAWLVPPADAVALVALGLAPMVAAGLVWAAVAMTHPAVTAPRAFSGLLAVTLMLAGPLASIGVFAARLWWPRLSPLVAATALAALLLAARAVVG